MKLAKLLCVSAMAFALVGCSSSSTSTTATAEATTAPTEAATVEATATAEAEEEVVTEGNYEVTNNTGATVTELYFYDATGSDKGENYAADGLKDGETVSVKINVDEATADGFQMKVEYVTEDGDSAVVFETLHLEDVPMYLKSAADIESGATPFSKPE